MKSLLVLSVCLVGMSAMAKSEKSAARLPANMNCEAEIKRAQKSLNEIDKAVQKGALTPEDAEDLKIMVANNLKMLAALGCK